MRKDAAQWTHDQGAGRDRQGGPRSRGTEEDGQETARRRRSCSTRRGNGWRRAASIASTANSTEAYTDAQLALRAVRILMREHWDAAVKRLTTPVACPFALSFYTLPRFWQYLDDLAKLRPGKNVLPEGDFEWPPDKQQQGWSLEEIPSLDDVEGEAKRVANDPREGKQCLMLKLSPKNRSESGAGAGANVPGHSQPGRASAARNAGAHQRLGACARTDHRLARRSAAVR